MTHQPIEQSMMKTLMAFKASERKDDPARLQNIHGPFEEMTVRKTGRLPDDYFTPGDEAPWGLRPQESRSNILWQVVSGIMDRHPEFGAHYMALALDKALGDKEYAKELRALNKSWGDYVDHAGVVRDHHHGVMRQNYMRVSCPACSVLTAMACRDAGMEALFREMIQLKPADRRALLQERGLINLLDRMIPDAGAKQSPRP